MKKIILLIAIIVVSFKLQAQTKLWLSGYHSNTSIKYLYDGKYQNAGVIWEGGTPKNNANVVVYGSFRKDEAGKDFFLIEKSASSVQLYSGNYNKSRFACPSTQNEGTITTSNGVKIEYASFIPLDEEGALQVTIAEWGIKVCNNKVYSMYYIREINRANVATPYSNQVIEQRVVEPKGPNVVKPTAGDVSRITGKVIGLQKETALNVKNYALILNEDGGQHEISSTRPMKVGEKITVEGSFKTVYWDGVMKTSTIFFVSRIIASENYGNNSSTNDNSNTSLASSLSSEEQKLYQLIMEYRKEKKLPSIPLSKSLTYVAQIHARDLQDNFVRGTEFNMHSWSDKGKWTACNYTPDHAQAKGMWNKPRELTSYPGTGYEISHWDSRSASAESALNGWKTSAGHNMLIISDGIWASKPWGAIGIGIYKEYALVWFGEETDKI